MWRYMLVTILSDCASIGHSATFKTVLDAVVQSQRDVVLICEVNVIKLLPLGPLTFGFLLLDDGFFHFFKLLPQLST